MNSSSTHPPPRLPAPPPLVVCFGELLWDSLPAALVPGGAPANVAYHLHGQGASTILVSSVGRDTLGDELLRRLHLWGVPAAAVARHDSLPTGRVIATIHPSGDASYEILGPVAWDAIPAPPAHLLSGARAVVHGSLALRSAANQDALDATLATAPRAWRVFDVNLRQPFDDLDLVAARARGADLLKLNATEAARLAGPGDPLPAATARRLARRFGARRVCITAGADGAGLLSEDGWTWCPGEPVAVADTVGAGDAFLATLLGRLLAADEPPARSLALACRAGEWVASHRGATPPYPPLPA